MYSRDNVWNKIEEDLFPEERQISTSGENAFSKFGLEHFPVDF